MQGRQGHVHARKLLMRLADALVQTAMHAAKHAFGSRQQDMDKALSVSTVLLADLDMACESCCYCLATVCEQAAVSVGLQSGRSQA